MRCTKEGYTLTTHDYPWCIFGFGMVCAGLAIYVLLQGDVANFFMVLLMSLFFLLWAKKRCLRLDTRARTFFFEEKGLLTQKTLQDSLDEIESIDVHYGRGRTITPSGFISVRLSDGRKFQINEYGACLFGRNDNMEMLSKLRKAIWQKEV